MNTTLGLGATETVSRLPRISVWQIIRSDRSIPFPNHQTLGEVLQLANIARPGVGTERLLGIRRQLRAMEPMRFTCLPQVVAQQQHHVFRSLTKRWNVNLDDVQAEIQILSEDPGVDPFTQVSIGCGDKTDVRSASHAINADRLDLSGLRESQQHGLHSQAHLAELIEKQCPAVGLSNQPRLVA